MKLGRDRLVTCLNLLSNFETDTVVTLRLFERCEPFEVVGSEIIRYSQVHQVF
jgi:hypothetical protein